MKIFITGGTGFIGKHVVNKLQNEELLILHQKNIANLPKTAKFIKGTLADIQKWRGKVKKFKPDVTIHLAWQGIPDYSIGMSMKNLHQGLELYKFLASIKCKTVLTTGSCWEYGGQKGKLTEKTLPKPFNAFTAAKNSLYMIGHEIAKEADINFIWIRLFYVYGPGQRKESLIPYLISCAKDKKAPEIKNPQASNDFIYVEDVADAIAQLISKQEKSDIFNIGSGKLTSIQDIIDSIFDLYKMKKQLKKAGAKQTDTLSLFYADISKIKQEIGWKPNINIKEGIKKTMESLSK